MVSLLKLADFVCDHYPWLDRDILISGVILHDIAKTTELGIDNGKGWVFGFFYQHDKFGESDKVTTGGGTYYQPDSERALMGISITKQF